jgi:outer membrane protein OmpA-like peptidoglycan-associated protein
VSEGSRRRSDRPGAVAAGGLAGAALLLIALGCAGVGPPRWRWDRDAEVLPLRQPAPPVEEPRLRSVVILLPDADGSVGVIEVDSPHGAAKLGRAREAVAFEDPSHTFIADDEQIREADRATLAAEPQAPQGFTVYFRSGGTRLVADSEAAWEGIVAALAARRVPEITITAHTDRAGDEEPNLALSEQRAAAIRDALVGAGLDADLIEVAWHGETRPAVATEDGVPELRNRRAEIRVR